MRLLFKTALRVISVLRAETYVCEFLKQEWHLCQDRNWSHVSCAGVLHSLWKTFYSSLAEAITRTVFSLNGVLCRLGTEGQAKYLRAAAGGHWGS